MAEPIICRAFNALFGWNMVVLNREKQNFPAADLGDRSRRIAVQVTNEDRSEKITRTARKAQEHGLGADFDRLIVFFLLEQKPGFPKQFAQPTEGPAIETWDITDVLDHALEQDDLERTRRASDLLDEELQTIGLNPSSVENATVAAIEVHQFDHGTYGLRASSEPVYTSFFEVTFPDQIQRAEIKLKRGVKFGETLRTEWAGLKAKGIPPVDYHIEQGVVYTFDDLSLPIWKAMIAARAIRPLDPIKSSSWAQSTKLGERNQFTKLLKRGV